jgi:molybdopterin-guanine dinucleotide biosynthesis protein A
MARHFKGSGIVLRFIEYMDVGATNGWRMDEVMPSAEVVSLIHRAAAGAAGPSSPWRDRRALGLCRRHRRDRRHQQRHPGLLPRLQPRPAVHRRQALPVPVRQPGPRPAHRWCDQVPPTRTLASAIGAIWQGRDDRYSELRASLPPDSGQVVRRVEMSYIPPGGPRWWPGAAEQEALAIQLNEITAMVLAGGRGSRMGGVDKGLQKFNGTPLALHTVAATADAGRWRHRRPDDQRQPQPGRLRSVWRTRVARHAGRTTPARWRGFMTGLERCETPYLLTVPCDTPLFPLDLAQRLAQPLTTRPPKWPWPPPRKKTASCGHNRCSA